MSDRLALFGRRMLDSLVRHYAGVGTGAYLGGVRQEGPAVAARSGRSDHEAPHIPDVLIQVTGISWRSAPPPSSRPTKHWPQQTPEA